MGESEKRDDFDYCNIGSTLLSINNDYLSLGLPLLRSFLERKSIFIKRKDLDKFLKITSIRNNIFNAWINGLRYTIFDRLGKFHSDG